MVLHLMNTSALDAAIKNPDIPLPWKSAWIPATRANIEMNKSADVPASLDKVVPEPNKEKANMMSVI